MKFLSQGRLPKEVRLQATNAASFGLSVLVATVLAGCGGGGDAGTNPDTGVTEAAGTTDVSAVAAQPKTSTMAVAVKTPVAAAAPKLAAIVNRSSAQSTAPGPGYFVDAVKGNDSNPGTFALPWKTLAKLTSARLKTGDGIYLQCGQVWRESLTLTWTQLVDGNTIAGYGDCTTAKATITGANDFSKGWVKSGNIWSRAVPASTPKIARLVVNSVSMRTAQWPNYGGVGNEYAISSTTSPSSKTVLQVAAGDISKLTGKDLSKAVIQVRDEPHSVDQAVITSYNAQTGTMTFTASTANQMEGGDGYVLQDKLWMLDAPGEFYHDTAAGRLYVYPSDATSQSNLNAVAVEGAVRNAALQVVNRANLSLKNLALVNTTGDALFLNEVPSVVVDSVVATGNIRSGIRVKLGTAPTAARGSTIQNSVVSDNWLYGIDATYGIAASILNNSVVDTGTIANAGTSTAAISTGDSAIIQNNSVQRAAAYGIRFSGTGGTQILHNDVTSYCVRLSDCGGIYTWNGPKGSQKTINQSSLINGNRIWSASANMQGSVAGATYIVSGIYLDDFSMGATVENNMVSNTPVGIYVHNGTRHTVQDNYAWFTTVASLWANMDQTDNDYMTGNVFSGNQLLPVASASGTFPAAPTFTTSDAFWFANMYTGLASLNPSGNLFSGNQIIQLNGAGGEAAWVQAPTVQQHVTANGWRGMNPSEPTPSLPATFSFYQATFGPELLVNGDFDTSLDPWGHYIVNPQLGGSLVAVSGASGCSGTCAAFTASGTGDMLNSPGFAMNANTLYVMGFNAGFSNTARVRPWIGRNVSPWDSLMTTTGLTSPTSLTGSAGDAYRYQGFFQLTTGTQVRLNLQMATLGVDVNLDTASIKQVTGYTLSKASDWGVAVFSNRTSSTSVSCTTLGWPSNCSVMGSDGRAIALPFTVPAGSAKVFLRADSAWRN